MLGLVSQMTRSEAERKKLDFVSRLQLNSNDYRIPSSHNFADAVKTLSRRVRAQNASRPHTLRVGRAS